jgi:two-component system, NtrC family, sensor kinase
MKKTDHQSDTDQGAELSPDETMDTQAEIQAYKEKIVQLSKLADLGQLSAGILHEIKNPVNFVNNFSRLSKGLTDELLDILTKPKEELTVDDLNDQKDIVETLARNLQTINDNGKRIERIIQGMLAQTRSDGAFFENVNLNQLLEEYTKLAYQSMRGEDKNFNVLLKFDFDANVGDVKLSKGDFGRVILNLVSNGCYAVNERKNHQPVGYDPQILVSSAREDDRVVVRVSDNGTGIPAEIVGKLFEAFFTTKPHGKGTGLGLSLTYSTIVDMHKGTISVNSVLGEKTEFVITLPLA